MERKATDSAFWVGAGLFETELYCALSVGTEANALSGSVYVTLYQHEPWQPHYLHSVAQICVLGAKKPC